MDKFPGPKDSSSKSLTFHHDIVKVAAGSEDVDTTPQADQHLGENQMEGQPLHYTICDLEDFKEAQGDLDHEKIGTVEVTCEEKLPPLSEMDTLMGKKVPTANGKLQSRVREAASADLQQKAAALNPAGGAIVRTEYVEEETPDLFRITIKADVYTEKSNPA